MERVIVSHLRTAGRTSSARTEGHRPPGKEGMAVLRGIEGGICARTAEVGRTPARAHKTGGGRVSLKAGTTIEVAIFQGFSRVMTRPPGRVKVVSKSRGSGRVRSGHCVLISHGSGRVGSRAFQNLAGRVGS